MNLQALITRAHQTAKAKGFWDGFTRNFTPLVPVPPEMYSEVHREWKRHWNLKISTQLMNLVSEVAEANEALRKGDMINFEEEMDDIFIRWADLMGFMGYDISGILRKMDKNDQRPPMHGKEF